MKQKCVPEKSQQKEHTAEDTDMWMVIAAVLAILLAAGAGFLTWRLTTGKTGKGSAGRKVHISRKGAYVDDGNLGGKSGELFRGTLWDDDGTVMTEQGYGLSLIHI